MTGHTRRTCLVDHLVGKKITQYGEPLANVSRAQNGRSDNTTGSSSCDGSSALIF